jgi:hypothetical protein
MARAPFTQEAVARAARAMKRAGVNTFTVEIEADGRMLIHASADPSDNAPTASPLEAWRAKRARQA